MFLALTLAIVGCAEIPRSGPVEKVSPSGNSASPVGLVAQPPADGATPQQIVNGFILASQAGVDDNFSVAREYLHADAAANWQPLAQIRLYPDTQNIALNTLESGAVEATVGTYGSVSAGGTFTETRNEAVATAEFSLAKNAKGQWRIVSLDDGIFLPKAFFSQKFVEIPLYFLSSDSNYLVADLRYYLKKSFATNAVEGLASGPSQWLADGVHTAIPSGTQVTKTFVSNGEAEVDLSNQVLSATPEQQALMVAQIRRTLSMSNDVRSVKVTVGGSPLKVEAAKSLPPYPFGSYPVSVVSNGAPGMLQREGVVKSFMKDKSAQSGGLNSIAASYQAGQSAFAATANNKTQLVAFDVAKGAWWVAKQGANLVSPSYDTFGWIWSGEYDNGGSFTVANPSSETEKTIPVSWLRGAKVRDIAVSRDGSRIVVVSEQAGVVTIQAAAIHRNSDARNEPTQIGDPMPIGQPLEDVVDVAWIGPTKIAVLGRTSTGSEWGLYAVRIGGPSERLMAPYADTVAITAGRDEGSIIALTKKNVAYSREGGSWRSITVPPVTSVALPG
jgi:Lipoprotein LpqB beta-propeller domain./Sporulation and spore germination.